MALLVVDTSLLYVLTAIQRLDLLAAHIPLLVTNRGFGEHEEHASTKAHNYLNAEVAAKRVTVQAGGHDSQARALMRKYVGLSFTDAQALALAKARNGFLLADDTRLIEAAEAEECDWVDLAALLIAVRNAGQLDARALQELVTRIEVEAMHHVKAAAKRELGVH